MFNASGYRKTNSKDSKANTQAWIEFGISSRCFYKPPPVILKNVEYRAKKFGELIRGE